MKQCAWVLTLGILLVMGAGCGNRDVRIEGDPPVPDRELLAAAQRSLTDWRQATGRPSDVHDAAYAMRSHLLDAGYPFADVEFRLNENKHVVFVVVAGPAIELGDVHFPGREAISASELSRYFFQRGLLTGTQTPFVQGDVQSAIRMVARHYRSIGFLDVRAGPPDIRIVGNFAHITVPIREGTRYRITRIEITGSEATLASLGGLANQSRLIGQPFHRLLIAEVSARLRGTLGSQGHLAPIVTAEEQLDPTTGAVELTLHVEPGPRIRRGDITVSGNRRTHSGFIRGRITGVEAGKPIDVQALDDSIRRLYNTGLFNQVTITPVMAGDGVADLQVEVSEASSRSVALSLGWGSYEQLRGSLEWVDDNVFGAGLRFLARGRASLKGYGVDTGLLERHHLGEGRSVGVDLRYDVREEPSFLRTETVFTTTFRHEFLLPMDPSARWSYRTVYALSFNDDDEVDGEIPGEELTSYRLSTITIGVQRDSRAIKPVDPEAGTLIDASIGWSTKNIGSEVPFVDHRIRWTHHRRLSRSLVGVLNYQAHTRDPLDSSSLPIGERLFLGGDASVRSFTKDALGPKDDSGTSTGGLSSTLANLELRWRPWSRHPNIELSAFYDIGSLGAEPWAIDGPAGQAVGGGIRYILPVGPIRFDAAWNPGETFGEDRYALHLTVGFAF